METGEKKDAKVAFVKSEFKPTELNSFARFSWWFFGVFLGSVLCLVAARLANIVPSGKSPLNLYLQSSNGCSDNGVWLEGLQLCLCNLGYESSDCEFASRLPPVESNPSSWERNLLIVTDNFAGFQWDASNEWDQLSLDTSTPAVLENLAIQLSLWNRQQLEEQLSDFFGEHEQVRKVTYNVTVLYTGRMKPNALEFAREHYASLSSHLHFELLPVKAALSAETGLRELQTSYSVFRYLLDNPGRFDSAYFAASRGNAFFSLRAKAQGLLVKAPVFTVLLDDLPASVKTKLMLNQLNFVPTETEVVKSDYLLAVSLELADKAVFPSKYMYDFASHYGYRLPLDSRIIPPPSLLAPKLLALTPNTPAQAESALKRQVKTKVRELIFLAKSLDAINGLQVFCEALTLVQKQWANRSKRKLKVTFIGGESLSEASMTLDDYLQLTSLQWEHLEWEVITGRLDWNDTLHFIKSGFKEAPEKLVVLPSLVETTSFLLQELVYAGIPVLASDLPSNRAVINPLDRNHVLFAANQSRPLSLKLMQAIFNDTIVPRPFQQNADSLERFVRIFAEAKNHTVQHLFPTSSALGSISEDDLSIYGSSDTFNFLRESSGVADPLSRVRFPTLETNEMPNPLITVVLVHRNRPQLLRQAIASLEAQTYSNFEVVLVDDGSDDNDALMLLSKLTWAWWEERQWKVVRAPHVYLGAARNKGVEHSRGSYLLFMDDDDYAKPHQIETMVKVLKSTRASIVTAGHDTFTGASEPHAKSFISRYLPLGSARKLGMRENCFGDSAFMVQKSVFIELGGFTELKDVGFEDYEFLARAVLENVRLEAIPEALHWYRLQSDSMSAVTDLKSNQNRALGPYFLKASHNMLSNEEVALLGSTKQRFFERDSPVPDYYVDTTDENRTIPLPDPVACPHPTMIWVPECGSCYYVAPTLDCAGYCPGNLSYGHHMDCAGTCLPRGQSPTVFVDACGVCGGNNATCTDCLGVLNGTATRDSCGVCNGDGTLCFALTQMWPTAIPNTGANVIKLLGAGFTETGTTIFLDNVPIPLKNIAIAPNNQTFAQITIDRVFDLNNASYISVPLYARNLVKATTTLTLTVYDPNAALLNLVSDKAYVRNSSQIAEIVVRHAVKTPQPTSFCQFQFLTYMNSTRTLVTYVNDTLITCPLPKVYLSQGAQLFVYYGNYSVPIYYVPAVLGYPFSYTADSLILKYYEPQPMPLSAVMDNVGDRINIRFNKPTTALIGTSPCVDYFSTMLDDPHVSVIQDTSIFDCNVTWMSSNSLYLSTRYSFRAAMPTLFPQPNLYIKFKPLTIGSRSAEYTDYTAGKVLIHPPFDPIKPYVNVRAPPIFSNSCYPSVSIDLSATVGAAGSPFLDADFTFRDLNYSSLYPNFELDYALVNASLELLESSRMVFEIPTNYFHLGHEYLLKFELTNFLGQKSAASVRMQNVFNGYTNSLVINGPRVLYAGELFLAQAFLDVGVLCNSSTVDLNAASLSWRLLLLSPSMPETSTAATDEYIQSFVVGETNLGDYDNLWEVGLKPNFLSQNSSYVLVALLTADGAIVGSASFRFRTFADDGELLFDGGNYLSQSTLESVNLEGLAVGFSDLNALQYRWSCITAGGMGCMYPGSSPNTYSQLIGPQAPYWTIAAGLLPVDDYIFSLAAYDPVSNNTVGTLPLMVSFNLGARALDGSFTISATTGRLRVRQLKSPNTADGTLAAEAYLEATSDSSPVQLFGVDVNSVHYEWSGPVSCLADALEFTGLTWSSVSERVVPNSRKLYLSTPNLVLPGSYYCIRVSAFSPDKTIFLGQAEVIMRTLSVPTLGECSVFNSTGQTYSNYTVSAFEDYLRLECSGSNFENGQLLYGFSIVPVSVSGLPLFDQEMRLGTLQRGSSLQTQFAPGTNRLYVHIYGATGQNGALNVALESFFVEVFAEFNGSSNLGQLWSNAAARYNSSRKSRELLNSVALLSQCVTPTSTLAFKRRRKRSTSTGWDTLNLEMVRAVAGVLWTTPVLDPYNAGPYFVQALGALVNDLVLYSKYQSEIAGILYKSLGELTGGIGCVNWVWTDSPQPLTVQTLLELMETWLTLSSGTDYTKTQNLITFRSNLATSVSLSQICGEFAANFTTANGKLKLSVGVFDRVYHSSSASPVPVCDDFYVGSFSADSINGFNLSQECFQYVCGLSSINYLTPSTNMSASSSYQMIDSNLYSFTFNQFDSAVPNMTTQPLFPDADFRFTVALSQELLGKLATTPSWAALLQCAYYASKYANSDYSTDGCQLLDFNGTHLDCSCSHLTEFVSVVGQSNLGSQSTRPMPNVGLILGVVLGVFALILLVMGGLLVYRRGKIQAKRLQRALVGTDVAEMPGLTAMDASAADGLDGLALAAAGIVGAVNRLPDNVVASRIASMGVNSLAEQQRLQRLAEIMYEQETDEVSSLIDLDNDPVPDYTEASAAEILGIEKEILEEALLHDKVNVLNSSKGRVAPE